MGGGVGRRVNEGDLAGRVTVKGEVEVLYGSGW